MRGIRFIWRFLCALLTAVLVLVLVFNVYTFVARFTTDDPYPLVFGYGTAVVLSGSMEDVISVNDLVIYKQQSEYEVGDIVSYNSGSSLVTHRIIELTETGYITKGDANNTPDSPILAEQVIGEVRVIVPGVGAGIEFAQSPLGMMILIGVLMLAVVLPSKYMGRYSK